MYLWLLPAVAGLAFLSLSFPSASARLETPAAALDARAEFERYRLFIYAAAAFMSGPAAARAGQVANWQQIRTTPGLPPGLVPAALPPSWRIVVADDGSWLACTEMSEQATAAMASSMTPQRLPGASSAGFVVLGAGSPAVARALAAQCES